MNFSDAFLGESSTLQTNFIHAVGVGLAGRGGHGEWQHVLGDGGASADIGVRADSHELMYRTECSDYGPLCDGDVAAKSGAVHEHHAIADDAIGSDLAGSWYLRARINDGGGMDHRGWVAALTGGIHRQDPLSFDPRPRELSMSWQETIASATFLSPTKA